MSYTLSFVLCAPTGAPLGEFIDADQRRLIRRLNVPGVATCTTQLESRIAALVLPGQSRLKIYRSPSAAELALNPGATRSLVWYGSLPADGVQEDTDSGLMTCNFQDPRWVLRDRYIALPFNYGFSNPVSTLLGNMLTDTNFIVGSIYDTWMVPDATLSSLSPIQLLYDAGKNIAQAWDECTQANLCDIDITPVDGWTQSGTRRMGSVRFWGQQGVDRPSCLFNYIARGGGNINGIRSTYAPIYNLIHGEGVDNTGTFYQTNVTQAGGWGYFGELMQWIVVNDPWVSAVLDTFSGGILAQQSVLRRIIEAGESTWEAPQPFTDYDLGDTVRLTAQRGTLQIQNASLRVMGYDLAPDQEGNVVSRVVLA